MKKLLSVLRKKQATCNEAADCLILDESSMIVKIENRYFQTKFKF